MAKLKLKKSKSSGAAVKIIVVVLILAVLIGAGVFFVPRLVHTCSNCDETFMGTGYYANVISNTLTDWSGEEDKILCNDCAATEHALSLAVGKSLDEFRRPLFE